MILIDSAFWASVGVTSSDGNADGSQYDFFNYIEMANGETVYNQYDFFKNSEVDGVFYNDHNEWARAVGVLYSESINNITDFYEVATADGINPLGNQYDFFNTITDAITADILQGVFNDYGFLNMWSSENINVSGTTTTLFDYASEHDLTNPSALSQPTLNASGGVGSESKPSLTFDGIQDVMSKNITDYRSSDSSGVFVSVYRIVSGTSVLDLGAFDADATTNYFNQASTTSNKYRILHNTGGLRVFYGTSDVLTGSPDLVATSASSGSAYYIIINGVSESLTFTSGSNDGAIWADSATGKDNIVIGGRLSSAPAYSNIEWCFGGYLPFVCEANIISLQYELKNYYGI